MSGDGKYLASGGRDRKVGVWDVEKEEWVKGFPGHRDTISVRYSTMIFSRHLTRFFFL
jgi:WD40 repeat protein